MIPMRVKIQRANLDGTNVEDVIPSLQFGLPGGVALAVGDGKIYWTNWGFPEGIQCANLDGSNVQTLVNTDDNPWDIRFWMQPAVKCTGR